MWKLTQLGPISNDIVQKYVCILIYTCIHKNSHVLCVFTLTNKTEISTYLAAHI